MTSLTTTFFGFLLICVCLLGALTLRLAAKARRQQHDLDQLMEALRQSQEDADKQKQQLLLRSDLDTAKDEFIATVSHELRTPLTSIRGALGLLSAGMLGNVDAKAQNLLRIASTNTERLIRLINDILDLERMESGRAPLSLRRCSLFDVAREAQETMTAMADAANVRLDIVCNVPPDSVHFDGDPDRMLQVLTNLLSNAIKFSPPTSTVSIKIDASQEHLVLKVVDQGRGIPAEKLETIFDRFQQVETSDAQKKGGTGLGLAICRSIVQQHGGSIWAQRNQPSPGTTLWVQLTRSVRLSDPLPVRSPDPLPGTRLPLQPHAGGRSTDDTSFDLLGEGLILVCDDDASIRMVVAEQLRRHGYAILEADGGEAAIALARHHASDAGQDDKSSKNGDGSKVKPISAILLDLYMPGLSGWETLRQLKNDETTAAIPVVILSVASPTDPTVRAPDAQGWVQKPFNEGRLLGELGRVLHRGEGPAHILLVEDDQNLASVILSGFEEAHVRLDHASTRQEAMTYCGLEAPDLLILDLMLPDGDGYSLVDWLRRQPEMRSLPLVVYSGRELAEPEMSKLRLGPTEFLTKATVQPKEVEELVLTMVHRLRSTTPATSLV
jgi:signal transduction histidine kinase/DNA-binding response OmpR family regulator